MDEKGVLYRYLPTELEPPADMWNRLEKVLDDAKPNSFEKLDVLEISPPTSAWENIALALDEIEIPKKEVSFDDLLTMETAPPAAAWGNIEKLLDERQPVVRNIGDKTTSIKRIAIGLAIAACITSFIFLGIEKFDSQPIKQNNTSVVIKNKSNNTNQKNIPLINSDTQTKQSIAIIKLNNTQGSVNPQFPVFDNATNVDTAVDERELTLQKHKPEIIPIINTTHGKFANTIVKIKNALGNVVNRIGDYNTSSDYLAAIGPNGNSIMVSRKLADMIEFFREDSAKINNEEVLDKVMRESNVWRQKLIDWRQKVDAADANPSQMNFLDPIDLVRFFKENK